MTVLAPALDDADLRLYLLGLLPETQAETLEDAYLARPELWERLRGIEHDLLDDYAADRLDAADKEAFEGRYLGSPVLRERVAAARALRLAAPSTSRRPERPRLPARARWAAPVALAAGLVLALLSEWSGGSRPPQQRSVAASPTPPHLERPPKREPTPLIDAPALPLPRRQPPAQVSVLALSPVLLRGQQQPAALRIPPGSETLQLELDGDPTIIPASPRALEAIVETVEGQPVWRGEAHRASDPGQPSLIARVRVPAAGLAPDDYLLTLSTREADDALYRYFFRISP